MIFKFIKYFFVIYLIFLISFIFGGFLVFKEYWPYSLYEEIHTFWKGGGDEKTSLAQKLKNDLDIIPYRLLKNFPHTPERSYLPLEGIDFNARRLRPHFFLSKEAPKGYRLLVGTFDFTEGLHGAILLDHQGAPVRRWIFSHEGVDWQHPKDTNIFPHGFDIEQDGSMIVSFGGGGLVLSKYDFCGDIQWQKMGGFHHSVDIASDGSVWVWGKEGSTVRDAQVMSNIHINSGEVLREITLDDIAKANPEIDIFEIRKPLGNLAKPGDEKRSSIYSDPTHGNDIDVLNEVGNGLDHFFSEGDLLISLRNVNALFVVDPATLKIKWWRVGATRRQHDADWDRQNYISAFDNNTDREYSRIVAIDPLTYSFFTLLDGKHYDFYSEARGKHQLLETGGIVVVSADQGRVFETDSNGRTTFEFINQYDENQTLIMTDARFIPEDFFTELPTCR